MCAGKMACMEHTAVNQCAFKSSSTMLHLWHCSPGEEQASIDKEALHTLLTLLCSLRRDKNSETFPEGGELSLGKYGSINVPAESEDFQGFPYMHILPGTDEMRSRFPLLTGRLEGFDMLKVSILRLQ